MREHTGNGSTNEFAEIGRSDTRPAGLVRLGDLDDYKVADGDPDIRGWDVKTPDGQRLGKVEELIADPAAERVRYMEVTLDGKAAGGGEDRLTLIPIGTARLNDDTNTVTINRAPTGGFAGVPPYSRDRLTRNYETALCAVYGTSDTANSTSGGFYDNDLYDDRSFYGDRRRSR